MPTARGLQKPHKHEGSQLLAEGQPETFVNHKRGLGCDNAFLQMGTTTLAPFAGSSGPLVTPKLAGSISCQGPSTS